MTIKLYVVISSSNCNTFIRPFSPPEEFIEACKQLKLGKWLNGPDWDIFGQEFKLSP